MSCNSCSKSFSLLRSEKGCPGCGFSYCSKCLNHKVFLQKANSEVKVCNKCKNVSNSQNNVKIIPPDTYLKRIKAFEQGTTAFKDTVSDDDPIEKEIRMRLLKLKEGSLEVKPSNNNNIEDRLRALKDVPSTSQAELEEKLAKLKNVPIEALQSKPIILQTDLRTEQEQANDLLKEYLEHTAIDKKYKDEFEVKVSEIQTRLQKLKGSTDTSTMLDKTQVLDYAQDSEDEEEIVKKIIEKAKTEAIIDETESPTSIAEELPFCEICNEDATMRCLGCKYLFCRNCFMEHKDEDDGCDKFERYTAPK